ncbi:MAG TPA: hypothetical protein VFV86_01515 [Nitrososphaeraceae archaeon]|nr:hypothetical protein [Nitrososphaeraceae archaeon]
MSVDYEVAKENTTVLEFRTRIILNSINGIPVINNERKVISMVTINIVLYAI